MLKAINTLLLSCFNIGFIRFAPGTWGSIFGFLFSIFIHMSWPFFFFVFFLSLYIIKKTVKDIDPQWIVVDEFLGIMLCLLCIKSWIHCVDHIKLYSIGLIFFRFFDIVKPFPISWIDRILLSHKKTQALGIIVDDLIAGVMAFGCVLSFVYY